MNGFVDRKEIQMIYKHMKRCSIERKANQTTMFYCVLDMSLSKFRNLMTLLTGLWKNEYSHTLLEGDTLIIFFRRASWQNLLNYKYNISQIL